jgi:hypothetical protein
MQIETFNRAESTGDAQEKKARSYELAFAENKKFVNSKFGAHLFLTSVTVVHVQQLHRSTQCLIHWVLLGEFNRVDISFTFFRNHNTHTQHNPITLPTRRAGTRVEGKGNK